MKENIMLWARVCVLASRVREEKKNKRAQQLKAEWELKNE